MPVGPCMGEPGDELPRQGRKLSAFKYFCLCHINNGRVELTVMVLALHLCFSLAITHTCSPDGRDAAVGS